MRLFLFAFAQLLFSVLNAQPGTLDQTFNPTDPGYGSGDGPNQPVGAIARQSDGKILVGGDMSAYNGRPCTRLLRLTADGLPDPTFNPGTGPGAKVEAIAVQADGKILVGGRFSSFNGSPAGMLLRLNPDGSRDNGFNFGAGYPFSSYQSVYALVLQPDGKILVGSDAMSLNGASQRGLVRLNADDTRDAGFAALNPITSIVHAISLQSDGKILIGGSGGVTRLLSDGSPDNSFAASAGNGWIQSLALQPDGKVVIAGSFSSYNGSPVPRGITRLNANGNLDAAFNAAAGAGLDSSANVVTLQADGKILVGGPFLRYNNLPRVHLVRLAADGSLDTGFDPRNQFRNKEIGDLLVRPDGSVLYGSSFISAQWFGFFGAIDVQGQPIAGFNPQTGLNRFGYRIIGLSNGKMLVSGGHSSYNGRSTNCILQLNADLTHDTSFYPGFDSRGIINDVAQQADGKILVGGVRIAHGGKSYELVRLHPDGRWDSSFTPAVISAGLNPGTIYRMIVLQSGKILIGGQFFSYNGTAASSLLRLNPDGSIDPTFQVGGSGNNWIDDLKELPDGKLLVAGSFQVFNGMARPAIARLNSNGSIDATFDPPIATGVSGVHSIVVQADSKILVTGSFDYSGVPTFMARLLADGTPDPTFTAGGSGAGLSFQESGTPLTTTVLPNGKIVVSAQFRPLGGGRSQFIAAFNADGTVDPGFQSGLGPDSTVCSMYGIGNKILITGLFTSYDGVGRNHLALINGTAGTTAVPDLRRTEALDVAPNPASTTLRFDNPDGRPVNVSILDMSGRLISSQMLSGRTIRVNVQSLPAGTYLIKANGAGWKKERSRFFVRQ